MYTVDGIKIAMRLAASVFVLLLTACNSAAIYQDDAFNPPVFFGSHYVQEGETLYAIAWRYGRDYKQLAAVNEISSPYRIYPGQRIRLDVPEGFRYQPEAPATKPARAPATKVVRAPATSSRKNETTVAQKPKTATTSYKNKQSKPQKKSVPSSSSLAWSWPGSGPIIETYSTTGRINKGIDLGGSIGEPVYAAANGEVVYAGNGLLGYGRLIIVNHNEQYLSAYAHNHRILVREGETVKAGQKIAEIGSSGTNRPKLHFEIRKDGKPVNPMNYLPKR